MFPRLIFALLLIVLTVTQATILPALNILGIMPDLVLVAILLWSMTREPREGLLWAFFAGMFLGLLTLSRLGIDALALVPVVVIGWFSYSRFFRSGLLFPLLMTIVATLAHDVTLALLSPLSGTIVSLSGALRLGLLGALLNLIVVPPLYAIVYLLDSWIGRNETYART